MSTIKADGIQASTGTNTDLTLAGKGTGVPDLAAGFKVGGSAGVPTASIRDDAVTTAKIVDDAVTLAKMASGTDGVVITYDASGNPVHVGPGSDGEVLTSTGAGSPPAFEAAGGGAWSVKGSGTLSSASELEITSLTKNTKVYLYIDNNNENKSLAVRTSTDGGSNYADSSADYSYGLIGVRSEALYLNSQGDSSKMYCSLSSSSGDGDDIEDFQTIICEIIFPAATLTSRYRPGIHATFCRLHKAKSPVDAEPEFGTVWGYRNSATVFNAIKFFANTGNLTGSYLILEAN